MQVYKMLIDGKSVDSRSGEYFEVYNPATSEEIGQVPSATKGDVVEALESAQRAFEIWRDTPANKRAHYMHKVAEVIRDNIDNLSVVLTKEQGKPLNQSKDEVRGAASLIDYYAEETRRITGEIPPSEHQDRMVFVFKDPVGVVTAIPPWNFPLSLLARALAPALAAGCTVVAKPASETPLSTIMMANLCLKGGLPKGVFNVVTGSGGRVGEELVKHPISRKICFTGSRDVGKRIMKLSSEFLKNITLELGGQCPAIVCKDANLDIAVDAMIFQGFRNAGQLCNRVNRIYVEKEISKELITGLVEKARKIIIGDAFSPEVDMGPLINETQLRKVHSHVEDAIEKGGKVVLNGRRMSGGNYDKGFFYPPTLITGARHSMLVMQEETFGPVIGIREVRDLDEGIALSNDNTYGLSAFVFTRNLKDALYATRRLEAGSVWVNDIHGTYVHCPYGGMKESGLGREQSHFGVDEFLELKTVYLDLAEKNRGGYLCVH